MKLETTERPAVPAAAAAAHTHTHATSNRSSLQHLVGVIQQSMRTRVVRWCPARDLCTCSGRAAAAAAASGPLRRY